MAKKNGSKAWIWISLLVLAGGAWWGGHAAGLFGTKAAVEMKGARVKKGPLTISVLVRGNLSAKDAVSVKSEIEGQTTILSLIKEGTQVKPGDLLCELDSSALIEKKVAQEINVQTADAAYTKAKAQYDIQDSQNKSDIEAAERKLKFAQLDLQKYDEGDRQQQLSDAENKIVLADSKKSQAENTATWSHTLNERGFLTKTELERDEFDLKSAQVSLDQAKLAKNLLVKYDDPRKRTELEANLKEAERGLERAKLKAQAMIADYESSRVSCKAKFDLESEKLQKYVDQLAKTKIRAPTAGMVVYARVEGGRMGNDSPIAEGTSVRERQEIMQIPRTGGMVCEGSVHESVLKLVSSGMPCRITIDALPGLDFPGEVQSVAVLPDKGSWWSNPNTRLYPATVAIKPMENPTPAHEKAYADMRPGMSCKIEILSAQIESCLYVPVQCVVLDKGETTAFVHESSGARQVRVKVGRSNEKFVEVLEGLSEDQEVLLAPPPGFVPAQAEDKGELPKAAAAPAGGMPAQPAGGAPGTGERAAAGAGTGDPNAPGGNRPRMNFDPANFDPSQLQGRMKERWDAMSEEERKQFLENMRSGNFGPGGPGGGGRRGNRGSREGGGNGGGGSGGGGGGG